MIIDHDEDILKVWANSHMNLLIQARPGNGKTNKAIEIMKQMAESGHSVLLLSDNRNSWLHGLNKSSKIRTASYEVMSKVKEIFSTDLLVIDDHYKVMGMDSPMEKINYKYVLILADDSRGIPSFFKGEVIRLINWNNITGVIFDEDKRVPYQAISNNEDGTMLLSTYNDTEKTEIRFPIDVLKKLLLE